MNALTLQNVTKSYNSKETPAVNNISFDCHSCEVVALIGSSGSGKTTLLRIIAGLEAPDYGEVILNDNILNSRTVFVTPEKRDCGLVFQDFALFPNKTVQQNITFGKGAMDNSSCSRTSIKNGCEHSFLSQLESVPSNIDSGNCGDFMSIAMINIL